jgi:NADH-quinone oxidoreductase subunit L
MNYFGIELTFRLDHLSGFIAAAICGFTILTALYALAFFSAKGAGSPEGKNRNNLLKFYAYLLISHVLGVGAALADNLVLMLFFWEGLLLVLFAMIAQYGGAQSFRTAIKAFIIVGISDLCMMVGIAFVGHLAGTLTISKINLTTGGLASIAFILLMIGAISKAGAMPFHTWIPDAAIDAPLPFMAYIPAALEKLLGIYFLSRICLNLFNLKPESSLSILLMVIGVVTILFAVMMALVQKNYKRLLSYHAVSQVGYMILGIGTAVPAGIVGGLFHMINHALYKSGLFFTAGAVEHKTGTADLEKLGGLGRKMPLTFACFLITAASISGVPPFNGFFSKELVYDAALERGFIFYIAALLGSFFTAASFLKLGHAAFLGGLKEQNQKVKEAPYPMLMVMVVIASLCILFGVYNYLPLSKFIQPAIGERLEGHNFYGFPTNVMLIVMTLVVLIGAFLHHMLGVRINGSGLHAVDHIYNFPLLHRIYAWQAKKYFDPYAIGLKVANAFSYILLKVDRFIDWVCACLSVGITNIAIFILRSAHTGNYAVYVSFSLVGMGLVVLFLLLVR